LLLAYIKILIRVLENGRKAPTLNKKTLITKVQHSGIDKMFCKNVNLKMAWWGRCLIGFICMGKSHQKLETQLASSEDTVKFNAF